VAPQKLENCTAVALFIVRRLFTRGAAAPWSPHHAAKPLPRAACAPTSIRALSAGNLPRPCARVVAPYGEDMMSPDWSGAPASPTVCSETACPPRLLIHWSRSG